MNEQETILHNLSLLDDQPAVAFESELNALVIVAHPDDETLWTGGLMLMVPHWRWRVISLCRGSDRDRRPRFFQALKRFDAAGSIGDLDDGPAQQPLDGELVESAIEVDLPKNGFDLVITHSPFGEYTRHLRHEEVSRGVTSLWEARVIRTKELWFFAYSDEERAHLPRAIEDAHLRVSLSDPVWRRKQEIVGGVYGFSPDSWEYRVTPREEAFWRFRSPVEARRWEHRRQVDFLVKDGSSEETKMRRSPISCH